MSLLIICILLLIYEIYLLVRNIKDNTSSNNFLLLSTLIISIIFDAIYLCVMYSNISLIGWWLLYYFIVCIVFFALSIILLVASSIIISVKKKKDDKNDKKNVKKKLIINAVVIIMCFVISMFIKLLPYKISERKDNDLAIKAKEKIVLLLNERYGNGNFKVLNMSENDVTGFYSMFPVNNGYEFEISSDYLNDSFIVTMLKDENKIYKDQFLNVYYKEKENIADLDNYLIGCEVKKLNVSISKEFNTSIDFNNKSIGNYKDNNFGHIPGIDEISIYAELEDPKIDIKEELTTKEELLNYLVKFTKFFIKDLDKTNIKYNQTDKYFRYKYDYKKLGVNNYTDQYNGYAGYVLAGEYKYSYEKERYVLEDEDKIVRINILGNVSTYNLEDILKDN